ncbi:adenylate/guanylate cyclase domain-containing protein [Leptospira sp. GIMC2001]|uniref:adenylate/guanylate cyclase domain-containing protein n=1 Tax=Leptospira sp. GIMC2001 TaxID=1513297 RepID=UPI00234B6C7C|nr:adenylate/guanylate cyclase domain-containing protein [Leptospira sp. GIMC2001]WCL48836.1 adenylate/guanylate cyclase domain-containing protein [Leptospira sp. GIMC2001]
MDNIGLSEEKIAILFGEPDDKFSKILQDLLSKWFEGYAEVTRRTQYKNFQEEINRHNYDLVILSSNFANQDLSENDLLEEVFEIIGSGGETPLVYFTDTKDHSFIVDVFKQGVTDVFSITEIIEDLMEFRFRNILRDVYRNKILEKQMRESITRFQSIYGMSLGEIEDLNSLVQKMKMELEKEFQNKLNLENEKKKMQSIFGMYVDPQVVTSILSNNFSLDQKGQSQEVTVLFTDIRGYTSLSEKLAPEQVISFLNEYFTSLTEVILGYNGMVDKYIGDSIMCLFGAPIYKSTHREDAIDTAIEMQSVFDLWVPKWEEIYGFRPSIGIGIASGIAVVGNVGSFQKLSYTAVGDTVNMASRLESLAKPGEVLVSEDFYNDLSDEHKKKYSFESFDDISIKGKEGLHKIYKVKE